MLLAVAASACESSRGAVPAAPPPATSTSTATPVPPTPTRTPRPTATPTATPSPPPEASASGPASGCGRPRTPGLVIETLPAAVDNREVRIYTPTGYDPAKPAPVVLNFHGLGQSAEQQETYSGLAPLADAKGFLLVTPEGGGNPRGWNIEGVYNENGIDDMAVIDALFARLQAVACIDATRVFATGHSNGGEMAVQLACKTPERIAAIAVVSGMDYGTCEGGKPIPLLNFHGSADRLVPYLDTVDSLNAWAAQNGCSTNTASDRVSASVTRQTWQGCAAPVVSYIIQSAGHTWPGAKVPGGQGVTTQEIDASALMWDFFAAHPRRH